MFSPSSGHIGGHSLLLLCRGRHGGSHTDTGSYEVPGYGDRGGNLCYYYHWSAMLCLIIEHVGVSPPSCTTGMICL